MAVHNILDSLKMVSPTANDLIVINGGEPCVHKDFYKIISEIQTRYSSEIAIYTNGTLLDISNIHLNSNMFFIIPIHGEKQIHDNITQIDGLYNKVINNLKHLNVAGFRYRMKFIINQKMIDSHFCIDKFLQQHNLCPEEIILARLNETTKSKKNCVYIPNQTDIKDFISGQINSLGNSYSIKLLDIPLCFINSNIEIESYNGSIPIFYFNDMDHRMIQKEYFKDVMIGNSCRKCQYSNSCLIMKRSYLTLAIKNSVIRMERE